MAYGGTYLEGSPVRVQATFAVSGTNTDPTTITLRVEDPDGNVAVYTYALGQVTRSATGVYYKDLGPSILDDDGTWVYRWEGTGTAAGVAESPLRVYPSEVV